MREELERGNTSVIHSDETNPQDVAALFKEFFRDLPDPLLTRELYAPFLATRSKLLRKLTSKCYSCLFLEMNQSETPCSGLVFCSSISGQSRTGELC